MGDEDRVVKTKSRREGEQDLPARVQLTGSMATAQSVVSVQSELYVGRRRLVFDDVVAQPRLGRMRRTDPSASGEELRQRLAEDGYVYLPQLFPREAVIAALDRITEPMSDFLLTGGEERTLSPDAKVRIPWKTGWLQEQQEVMRVVEGKELFDTFERVFDEPASTFDYKWFRAVGPGGSSTFHFDGIYMK